MATQRKKAKPVNREQRRAARSAEPEPSAYLSVRGVAETTGVGEWAVKKAIRDGRLASVKFGARRLIPRAALAAYLAETASGPPEQLGGLSATGA